MNEVNRRKSLCSSIESQLMDNFQPPFRELDRVGYIERIIIAIERAKHDENSSKLATTVCNRLIRSFIFNTQPDLKDRAKLKKLEGLTKEGVTLRQYFALYYFDRRDSGMNGDVKDLVDEAIRSIDNSRRLRRKQIGISEKGKNARIYPIDEIDNAWKEVLNGRSRTKPDFVETEYEGSALLSEMLEMISAPAKPDPEKSEGVRVFRTVVDELTRAINLQQWTLSIE